MPSSSAGCAHRQEMQGVMVVSALGPSALASTAPEDSGKRGEPQQQTSLRMIHRLEPTKGRSVASQLIELARHRPLGSSSCPTQKNWRTRGGSPWRANLTNKFKEHSSEEAQEAHFKPTRSQGCLLRKGCKEPTTSTVMTSIRVAGRFEGRGPPDFF